MLSKLFKMALEKCNELNNNAPLTKNLRQTYYVKSSYEHYVFSNMFEYETATNVQKINSFYDIRLFASLGLPIFYDTVFSSTKV